MIDPNAAGPGIRTFRNICEKWGLSIEQQHLLLGDSGQTTRDAWCGNLGDSVPEAVLIRVSYVLGIYKALHTKFTEEGRADSWMKQPNSAPLFSSRSAIDLILDDGLDGLANLRNYLDASI